MDLGLKGKRAAITGPGQGIEYAMIEAPTPERCHVAVSARITTTAPAREPPRTPGARRQRLPLYQGWSAALLA